MTPQLPQSPRVRAGTVVQPETVTVADPFTLTVTVEVPVNARVEWPALDTAGVITQRAAIQISDKAVGDVRQETATYRLSAWDTGAVTIAMPEAVVRFADSRVVRVPLNAQVYVESVLPGDTTQHVPRPARDLFPRVIPWWEQWWPTVAIALALALIFWLLRRKKRSVRNRAAGAVDAYTRAMQDFDRLDRLALADSGERGRYVALSIEILRSYLARRVGTVTLSQTSTEVVHAVQNDTRVPVTRLAPLLLATDGVKFGNVSVSSTYAHSLAAEARAIVSEVEKAELERVAAVREEAKQSRKELKRAREQEIDEAKRDSRRRGAA